MANKFVWDGATGAADGSTWEDAYPSVWRTDWSSVLTPATDVVYVRSDHAESQATNGTLTCTSSEGTTEPVRFFSVVGADTGTTPGNLQTMVEEGTGNITLTVAARSQWGGGFYMYGLNFDIADLAEFTGVLATHAVMEKCYIKYADHFFLDAGTESVHVLLLNTDLEPAAVGQGIRVDKGVLQWRGGTLQAASTNLILTNAGHARIEIEGVDLTLLTSNVWLVTQDEEALVRLSSCKMGAGWSLLSGTLDSPGQRIESYHCQVGTDADPSSQMEISTENGTVSVATASYRTGGASDDERTNPVSWDMDTTVGSKRQWPGHALESPPIAGWTDGDATTAHTYRIYFASGGTQDEKDIWFELQGPNDAATNSLGIFVSASADQQRGTRIDPEGTEANYTTDTGSNWTGADVGTKQYMEITYTPDKPGPMTARVFMVSDEGSTGHIYIDPQIVVDP